MRSFVEFCRDKIKNPYIILTILSAAAFAIGLFLCSFNIVPANDTCGRYAPMAEAFAAGHWKYAFHPMYGMFFSTVSGIFAFLFSLDGFKASQCAALLLWVLAVFPLFALFKRIWKEDKIALAGCILYLFCSHLHRYVYDGIRDNGRTLGLVLICLGLVRLWEEYKGGKITFGGCVPVIAGGVILSTLRADGFLISAAGLCFVSVLDILRNRFRSWRSLAAWGLFVLLVLPQVYLTWKVTEVFAVSSRHSEIIQKMLEAFDE